MKSERSSAGLALFLVANGVAHAQLASPPVQATISSGSAAPAVPIGSANAQAASNLVINGDFENHTGSGCQYNIPSASVGSILANTTGFGAANEIDLMDGVCYGPVAVSGTTKIGIHTKGDGSQDELSFDLATPIVAGASYTLSFWSIADTSFDPGLGHVTVGLSNDPISAGTQIYTAVQTVAGMWTQFTHNFVAPVGATYLTLSSGPMLFAWSHVDLLCLASGCGTGPNYCTAGTTTNGCTPAMSASGTPSAAASSGYTLMCSGIEGQKSTLIFYGNSGAISTVWGVGSTSFLCVKAPTQRTVTMNSGGNLNTCTGQVSIDFLAFMAANPSALGQPIAAGQQYNAQTWFRDPPAAKTTNLSDALSFVLCP